jgi:glycosyltransferase involved in cell wall biosynthesis
LKKITILCPVYNEEHCLPIFCSRVNSIIQTYNDKYIFELLFSNNCSTDNSLEIISNLKTNYNYINYITLSRNFGYQASLIAGLNCALGDYVIIIDADCEDPPEMISKFLAKMEEGYDVVYGRRINRPESYLLRTLRKLFYWILKSTADASVNLYMAEFSLISNKVRNEIIKSNNSFPFIRAEISYIGFKQTGINYTREKRVAGKTNYNFVKMTLFAIAGILSSSTFLLRLIAYLFPFILSVNLIIFLIPEYISFNFLLIFNIVYLNFVFFVFSLYLARIYKNILNRSIFIIDQKKSNYTHNENL